jgi:hypothetical protein
MCFNFQVLVHLSIAGLTDFAQVDSAWKYLNWVWLEGIQFLGWGRKKAGVGVHSPKIIGRPISGGVALQVSSGEQSQEGEADIHT